MKIKSYVMAADPTWIEASVSAYYHLVEEIVVSYDKDGKGWTGKPIPVEECLKRLRALDKDSKMRFVPGTFARPGYEAGYNETYQRQCAMEAIGDDCDWIFAVDTDEVLPRAEALVEMAEIAAEKGIPCVDFPMRVLFRKLADGRYLEVCSWDQSDRFEYPGYIAVRPGVKLTNSRHTALPFLRPIVEGDNQSLQVTRPAADIETRVPIKLEDAILHNSWAREEAVIRSKMCSFGHNAGWKTWLYYYTRWYPAPYMWRYIKDFHPFAHGLWPRLKPCTNPALPGAVAATA